MIIDVHCHYTFTQRQAAVADRFSFEPAQTEHGPAFDSCVAPRLARQYKWRVMQRLMRLPMELRPGPVLDTHLDRVYEQHLLAEGPIDRYVLLAFDEYHDNAGRRLPFPTRRRQLGTDIYMSNTLVRDACRRHPDRFLFGCSVHPYRADAVACVEEVFAAGACLMKWMPLHQNIDADDPRTRAVLAKCSELRLPVLVHYGEEFTLRTNHPEFRPVTAWLEALRELRRRGCMPPTIVAHVATPTNPLGEWSSFHSVVAAMRHDFARDPLYADISALAVLGKLPFLSRVARMQDIHHKLLFGSDFPVPLILWPHRRRLGREYDSVQACPSWPQQTAAICRAAGFNEIVMHHAAGILPNVDHSHASA